MTKNERKVGRAGQPGKGPGVKRWGEKEQQCKVDSGEYERQAEREFHLIVIKVGLRPCWGRTKKKKAPKKR